MDDARAKLNSKECIRIKGEGKITWNTVKVSTGFEEVVVDIKVRGYESKFEKWMWFEISTDAASSYGILWGLDIITEKPISPERGRLSTEEKSTFGSVELMSLTNYFKLLWTEVTWSKH